MKSKVLPFLISVGTLLAACDTPSKQGGDTEKVGDEAGSDREMPDSRYINLGDSVANTAFKTLSGELKAAMAEGGVKNATEYCNVRAYPLSDSVGKQFGVKVMRLAERFRNPGNRMNEDDAEIFRAMKERRKSTLHRNNNTVVYYKPIETKPLCLSCHGTVKNDIGEINYEHIKKHYPDDRAVDFKTGDLRGMWKITFPADNS